MSKYTYSQYIADIEQKKIKHCRCVRLAILRHLSDIKKSAQNDYPYKFDEKRARLAVDFFREMRHHKGRFVGKAFEPEPWQQFIIASLYGWRHKKTDLRRFKRAYVQVARKNGKTFLASGSGIYDLITEPGAQVYAAATKKEQALLCWTDAKMSVSSSEVLSELIITRRNTLIHESSTFIPLSKDTKSHDGFNPSWAIIDEYHAHNDDAVVNVMLSGMGARDQPMLFIITTAGHNINCPCYEEYERVKKMLEGRRGYENEEYFAIVYELDKRDSWRNPDNWIKANPNLGVSISLESLQSQYKNALQKSTGENEFRVKNLNVWMVNTEAWISAQKWEKCHQRFDISRLDGLECVCAIDLAKRQDFNSVTYYFFVDELQKFAALHRFFVPKDTIYDRMKTDSYLIETWIKEKYITETVGYSVDQDVIFNTIIEDSKKYHIIEIVYDRNLAIDLIKKLSEQFTCAEFNQAMVSMSEPSKEWERDSLDGKIIDNNPVMAWHVSCAETYTDGNDNIKVLKPKAMKTSKRIDGVITSIMARDRMKFHLEKSANEVDITKISY